MNENDLFTCEDCQGAGPLRFLSHRETMPGDYCLVCAENEKCGCCSEVVKKGFLTWKEDVRNYICENCQFDYKEVAQYIRPLTPVIAYPNKKAA